MRLSKQNITRLPVIFLFVFSLILGDLLFLAQKREAAGAEPAAGLLQNKAFHPHRILVKLRPGMEAAVLSPLHGQYQTRPLRTFHGTGIQVIELPEGADPVEMVQRFQQNPAIEYAEPDYVVKTNGVPNDPRFSELWGMSNTGQTGGAADADIDAPEAWDVQTGNSAVVISLIDTGIDYNHEDLAANIWINPGEDLNGNGIVDLTDFDGVDTDGNGFIDDLRGWNFVRDTNDPFDDNGHGTHTGGTLAAIGNNGVGVAGVNWTAKIMPLKFLDQFGSGFTSDAIAAIDYATNFGVLISSNSWGGGGFSSTLQSSISACNCLFVAAAGNGGSDGIGDNNDLLPQYPASYPLDNIISVAATDHNDNRAGFSNYGAASVDLGAPGVNILSSYPGNSYILASGTSMATPHVAGAAGLLLARDPALTVPAIKDRILSTVDPIISLGGITLTGGRLNVASALTGAPAIDTVAILRAAWQSARKNLVVTATSTLGGNVTLTATGFGNLVYNATTGQHRGIFRNVTSNPGTVTVTSTGGGSDTGNVITR